MGLTASKYMELVTPPGRDSINTGLSPLRHSTMLEMFDGAPGRPTRDCTSPTNPRVVRRLAWSQQITPQMKVSGLSPAIASLRLVMNEVKVAHPLLWSTLVDDSGMLCCRLVRGSDRYFSNHSIGTAIDLRIGGILAPLNATKIPYGLLVLYYYFHKYGWFWAQGYRGRTDPMHYEIADETLRRWKREGLI